MPHQHTNFWKIGYYDISGQFLKNFDEKKIQEIFNDGRPKKKLL